MQASIGQRVRDAKWGSEYVGTVVRQWADGDIGVRWDGHFTEDQLSEGEYVSECKSATADVR
jgi:hypothetical protein